MTPRVYAPQQPSKFDGATKLWIPTMNLDPAKRFGELVILLPPSANRLHTDPLVKVMKDQMEGYSDKDYLIAVGDPSLIAAAAMIAYRRSKTGTVRILKWDRVVSDYIVAEITV